MSFVITKGETIVKINGDKYVIYENQDNYWVEIEGNIESSNTKDDLLSTIKSKYITIDKFKVKTIKPFNFY
jgi:hypothetical protein